MSDPPKPPRPPAPNAPKPPTAKTSSVPLKKETVRITLRAKPGEGGAEEAPGDTPAPPAAAAPAPAKPAPPAGNKTIPLSPTAAPQGAAPAGKATVQLKTAGGAPAQSLPKATVQLQRTQPVSSAPPASASSARLQTSSFDVDDEDEPAGITPVAIGALAASFILLLITMAGGDKVGAFVQKNGSPSWGVPADVNKYDSRAGGGNFEQFLPEIPSR